MGSLKVAIIGGGSAYAPSLIYGFIGQAQELPRCKIVLMDINAEHLEIVGRLAKRLIESAGLDLKVETTLDRKEAIKDADYVITTFRPGGYEAYALDEKIPMKYNVIGQETTGPGGMFFAFRSISVMLGIAKDIEKLAPDAWIINYTNPTNIVTKAIIEHTDAKILGLCDEAPGELYMYSKLLKVDTSRLEGVAYGLNHAWWFTDIFLDNKSIMKELPTLFEKIKEEDVLSLYSPMIYSIRLFKIFGLLPTVYLRYYYYHDEILSKYKTSPITRAEEMAAGLDAYYKGYLEESKKEKPQPKLFLADATLGTPLTLVEEPVHGDFAVNVICAVEHNKKVVFPLNVPNKGSIRDFTDDTIVEVPAVLGKNGARPLSMGYLHKEVSGLLQAIARYENLVADAGVEGSKDKALKALLSHPFMSSRLIEVAKKMLAEMFAAERKWLPQFKD